MVMKFTHHDRDYERWDAWDTVELPVLCLRGEHSDLLRRETVAEMQRRRPRARVIEVTGCGHAPALNTAEQLDPVAAFIAAVR